MTAEVAAATPLLAHRPFPARLGPKGTLIYKLMTTTDHKLIGIMYCVACFIFFFIGGLMALLMRTELATPGLQFLSNGQYNQLFTIASDTANDSPRLVRCPPSEPSVTASTTPWPRPSTATTNPS